MPTLTMAPIIIVLIISVLGPVVGSLIGVIKKPTSSFIHLMLAFAAGVMLAVSFLELIPESVELSGAFLAVVGIVIGSVIMYALDKLIPHIHPELCSQEQGASLKKTSIYLILGIFLHNFPEGMAIAIGRVTDFRTALIIAISIAIHNIAEGICTSAPFYFCTKKRLKSFLVSSMTAIPILVGFIVAYFAFGMLSPTLVGIILAATAGLMIYISADELIPSACSKARKEWSHATIFALIAGIVLVMLLGLVV